MLQHIYLCCSAHSWYWQVVSLLWEEHSSLYFLIMQLLPVPSHVFLSFQDFLSPFNKEQGRYKFFQVEEHFPYVCHFQKPNSFQWQFSFPFRETLSEAVSRLLINFLLPILLLASAVCAWDIPCLLWPCWRQLAGQQMSLLSCWEDWSVRETWPSHPARLNTPDNLLFCH